jgi:type VI secretion system secreted protein Hcp
MAAFDYFLKIDGIEGESTDQKHKGEIEVLSFSWGETQPGTGSVGGGGGAGKVQMQDFRFVAHSSKASPKLFLACATGQHIKKAVLFGRKTGGGGQEFLTFTLTDALVSQYQIGDSVEDDLQAKHQPGPRDNFSLNFSKIEFELNGQRAGWDQRANKSV